MLPGLGAIALGHTAGENVPRSWHLSTKVAPRSLARDSLLTGDPPGGTAGHAVPEQPHLHLGDALVVGKGQFLGEIAVADSLEEQGKCLGANEIRGDDLMIRVEMIWVDLDVVGDECRRVGASIT